MSKIGSPFCPITEADARRWYKASYLSTPGYILAIQRITVPPGAVFAIANIKEFCSHWGITRSAFYRAVDVLKANNECPTIETQKALTVSHDRDINVPQAEHACPTIETSMSHDRDNVSHERDTAIYNERARAQRSENKKSIERDLRGEGDRSLEEKVSAEQEQITFSDVASQSRSDRNSTEVRTTQEQATTPERKAWGSGEDSSAFSLSRKNYQHGGHAANDRFSNGGALPPWKIGYGPNDWDTELLQDIANFWNQTPGKNFTVASVMGFIGKRDAVTHPQHAQLLQTCKEAQAFGDERRRKQQETQRAIAAASYPSPAEPYNPPKRKIETQFTDEELRLKLRGMGLMVKESREVAAL